MLQFSYQEVFGAFHPENVFGHFHYLRMESQPCKKEFHKSPTVIFFSLKLTIITRQNVLNYILKSNVCTDTFVSVVKCLKSKNSRHMYKVIQILPKKRYQQTEPACNS